MKKMTDEEKALAALALALGIAAVSIALYRRTH